MGEEIKLEAITESSINITLTPLNSLVCRLMLFHTVWALTRNVHSVVSTLRCCTLSYLLNIIAPGKSRQTFINTETLKWEEIVGSIKGNKWSIYLRRMSAISSGSFFRSVLPQERELNIRDGLSNVDQMCGWDLTSLRPVVFCLLLFD